MFPHMYRVRQRNSADKNSEDGKPEWQSNNWRRNSNRWPPTSGGETPPTGAETPPTAQPTGSEAPPLCPSPSSSRMSHGPPPVPAPPPDPQEDLRKSGSPAVYGPHGAQTPPAGGRQRQRPCPQDTGALTVPSGGPGPRSRSQSPYEVWGTPKEQWQGAEGGSRSTPSSSTASPRERRRRPQVSSVAPPVIPDVSSAPDTDTSKVRSRPTQAPDASVGSGPTYSDRIRNRDTCSDEDSITRVAPDENSYTESYNSAHIPTNNIRDTVLKGCAPGSFTSNEVSGDFNNEPSSRNKPAVDSDEMPLQPPRLQVLICKGSDEPNYFDTETNNETNDTKNLDVSPEVADEWKDLLDDAIGDHDEVDSSFDPNEDFDFESGKNPFYQAEAAPELFQGGAVSYIPTSQLEFLKHQEEEDRKYILAALDEERDVILRPSIEEKSESDPISLDTDHNKTDNLNASETEEGGEAEEEARAWSPGTPVFKHDLQRLLEERENDSEAGGREKRQADVEEDKPWWENDRPARGADSPVPWWEVEDEDVDEGQSSAGVVPQPPPPPGVVPPPPRPFPTRVDPSSTMPKIRKTQLDSIKKAVRTRPDWHALMKNLEEGVKLKHVAECSDRSQPILPCSRGKNGQFVYDSEKPTVVNELLHEIQRGVRLRHTRTDDRSRPDFNKLGLKRIRRQMTIEEKKKVKPEDPEALPSSSDEEEDIDKMRDDLNATKTQLADEIKKTKKIEREKKVMRIDIEALHAEIKKLKRQLRDAGIHDKPLLNGGSDIMPKLEKSMSKLRMSEKEDLDFDELDTIEIEIKELNGQIDVHRKRAETMEDKVYELEQKMKMADSNAEEWEGRAVFFEKKYKALQKDQNIELPDIAMANTQTDPCEFENSPCSMDQLVPIDGFGSAARKSGSRRSFASQINRMESFQEECDEDSSSSSSEESEEPDADEEDEAEEDGQTLAEIDDEGLNDEEKEAKRAENEAKRMERDRQLWQTKLDHIKEKEANVKKERDNLRERIKTYYKDMYAERVEYLKAKTELDELVSQLKDADSEGEEEAEEEEEEEEHPADEEPGWWFDKPELQPKKLKKKKKIVKLNADGEEIEEEEEEEDLEDLTQLEEPCYSDSEDEESDPEDENDLLQVRINFLQSRTKKHELKMNSIKKNNYLLKSEIDQCKEKYSEERLRRRRLDEELNMLVADMQ